MPEYDVIILGAGAVAENVADRVVQQGVSAILVESALIGGECSYWACMPSKALIRSGMALRAAQKLGGAREAVTGTLDAVAVFKRRDEVVHHWNDESQENWVEEAGISLTRGHGRLTGVKSVTVDGADGTQTELTARHAVVVSTGSEPLFPDVPGIREVGAWTTRDATSVSEVPASLAILGGGVAAVELATAFASFGTSVTIISRSELLRGQEDFVPNLVQTGLERLGVTVLTGVAPVRVSRSAAGVAIELPDRGLTAERLLIASGRSPRTTDIGLETVGLTPGDWLNVDDTMLVSGTDWLYATGDVNHRALVTHQGKYQARAAGDVIAARATGRPVDDAPWGGHVATADHSAVPQVAFCDPEVASVGFTAEAARGAGYDIRVIDYELGWTAGASLQAEDYEGTARLVVDEARKVVIGATFVGQDVSELIHAATLAIVAEVPIDRLWHAVPAYPTMNEIWLRLLEGYGRESAIR